MNRLERNTLIADKVLESTTSNDISPYSKLIKPLLYKIYTESLASEIADIQQLPTPTAKVFTLFSNYGGREGDELNTDNSSIVVVDNASAIAVDDTVSTINGQGVVVYKENNNLLIKITSGFFVIGESIGSATITDVISNRNYVRKVFKNYSGPYDTSAGEYITPMNIDHQVKTSDIVVNTRKLKSKISKEVLQDVFAMFGEDLAKDILAKEFGSEIIQSIDMELISYLRTIAKPISDVNLSLSYGTQNQLSAVADDLFVNIYKMTIDIMRETKRRKNFFVIADAATVGLMLSSPLHVKPEENKTNSYYMGKVGGSYNLYLDPYATDHYVLVGYRNQNNEELGDSGLIFAPYTNDIIETTEPESGKSIFFNIVRYGYITHPQDTTTGNADSIFFKTFKVNIDGLTNYDNIK